MIRGTKRFLPQVSEIIPAAIHNVFELEVWDARTGALKDKAQAHNTLCNNWWANAFSTSSSYYPFHYIHYGSGQGTPSSGDTALFNFVGGKESGEPSWGWDPDTGVGFVKKSITLSESEYVGTTLTEVGLSRTSSGNLCSHAMLKDMNGNPISLVKGDTDIVRIYATVFIHVGVQALAEKGIYINGVSRVINALCGASTIPGLISWVKSRQISGVTSLGAYSDGYHSTKAVNADAANRTLSVQLSRLGAGDRNYDGGLHTFTLGSYISNGYAMDHEGFLLLRNGDSGMLPPHQVTGEPVGTGDGSTLDFSTNFPLVTEATVYVDGQVVPDVVVDMGRPIVPENYAFQMDQLTSKGTKFYGKGIGYVLGNTSHWSSPGKVYYENPFWDCVGISKVTGNGYNTSPKVTVSAGDSLDALEVIGTANIVTIPESHRRKRYWSFEQTAVSQWSITVAADTQRTPNIHFVNPPAEGSVITVDYTTKVVPKDSNHVFDLSVVLQFNEYTEVQ